MTSSCVLARRSRRAGEAEQADRRAGERIDPRRRHHRVEQRRRVHHVEHHVDVDRLGGQPGAHDVVARTHQLDAGATEVAVQVAGSELDRLAGLELDVVEQQRHGDARDRRGSARPAPPPSAPRDGRSPTHASTIGPASTLRRSSAATVSATPAASKAAAKRCKPSSSSRAIVSSTGRTPQKASNSVDDAHRGPAGRPTGAGGGVRRCAPGGRAPARAGRRRRPPVAAVAAVAETRPGDRVPTGAVTASTTAATTARDDERVLRRCIRVTLRTTPGHGQRSGHASLNASPTLSAPDCTPSTT